MIQVLFVAESGHTGLRSPGPDSDPFPGRSPCRYRCRLRSAIRCPPRIRGSSCGLHGRRSRQSQIARSSHARTCCRCQCVSNALSIVPVDHRVHRSVFFFAVIRMATRPTVWRCRHASSISSATRPPRTSAPLRHCWPTSPPCTPSIMARMVSRRSPRMCTKRQLISLDVSGK